MLPVAPAGPAVLPGAPATLPAVDEDLYPHAASSDTAKIPLTADEKRQYNRVMDTITTVSPEAVLAKNPISLDEIKQQDIMRLRDHCEDEPDDNFKLNDEVHK